MRRDGDQVRIIVLEDGQHLESVIRKVEKGELFVSFEV